MNNQNWEYSDYERCACCKEWMEPDIDNKVFDEGMMYHQNCYICIVYPRKAAERLLELTSK
jgi:hypothetical protein